MAATGKNALQHKATNCGQKPHATGYQEKSFV